ncbi:MAG TPA: chitobiase/beta-hexosaminidase C-terminal domain-containing protein, partial [Blastocatellia bacterium]|nr:chitobiase/beta-hexosaminidase C-terminal domain-containing protein [Blastocatellia bacterium]
MNTATPVFSPAGGTYATAQSVKITDVTAGATIYYTTNGSTPTTSSTKYSGAIKVSTTETLKAIAVAAGYANSSVGTARYTLKTATPVLSPAGGTYATAQSVKITD